MKVREATEGHSEILSAIATLLAPGVGSVEDSLGYFVPGDLPVGSSFSSSRTSMVTFSFSLPSFSSLMVVTTFPGTRMPDIEPDERTRTPDIPIGIWFQPRFRHGRPRPSCILARAARPRAFRRLTVRAGLLPSRGAGVFSKSRVASRLVRAKEENVGYPMGRRETGEEKPSLYGSGSSLVDGMHSVQRLRVSLGESVPPVESAPYCREQSQNTGSSPVDWSLRTRIPWAGPRGASASEYLVNCYL